MIGIWYKYFMFVIYIYFYKFCDMEKYRIYGILFVWMFNEIINLILFVGLFFKFFVVFCSSGVKVRVILVKYIYI